MPKMGLFGQKHRIPNLLNLTERNDKPPQISFSMNLRPKNDLRVAQGSHFDHKSKIFFGNLMVPEFICGKLMLPSTFQRAIFRY